MLYALQVEQKAKPTETYIFGTRLLLTLGVEILGKKLDKKIFTTFLSIDEVIKCKFIHIVVENFTESYSVFENHAGCEKGYFQTSTGEQIALAKYNDRTKYKAGDKSQIVFIPDLVLLDIKETEAITIEGEKYEFQQNGIKELADYDAFDKMYLKKHYPNFKIVRTVVLYGSEEEKIVELQVGFLLNANGKLVLGIKAPKLFKRAINNLLDFWS